MTPRLAVKRFLRDRMLWQIKYADVQDWTREESKKHHHEWWSLFVTLMQTLSKSYGPVDQYRILKELDPHALKVWLTPPRAQWIIDSMIEGEVQPTEWNWWGEQSPERSDFAEKR